MSSIYTSDEVLAIVAHEIGHWHLNHVIKLFLFYQVWNTPVQSLMWVGSINS